MIAACSGGVALAQESSPEVIVTPSVESAAVACISAKTTSTSPPNVPKADFASVQPCAISAAEARMGALTAVVSPAGVTP